MSRISDVIHSFLDTLFLLYFFNSIVDTVFNDAPLLFYIFIFLYFYISIFSIFSLLLLSNLIKFVKFAFSISRFPIPLRERISYLFLFLFAIRFPLNLSVPIRRFGPKSASEYAAIFLLLFWCFLFINIVDLITDYLLVLSRGDFHVYSLPDARWCF